MWLYINKKSNKIVRRFSDAIDTTSNRDGIKVVIYSTDENEKVLLIKELKEFEKEFIPLM